MRYSNNYILGDFDMTVANNVKKVGQYTMYAGGGSLFIMACVGTVSIDLAFMAAMRRDAKEGNMASFLFTGWMWHCFAGANRQINPLLLLLASPIMTAIAVAISIALDVSFVGMYLMGGWALAASIFLAGVAIHHLGEWIDTFPEAKSKRGFSFFSPAPVVAEPFVLSDPMFDNPSAPPMAKAYPVL